MHRISATPEESTPEKDGKGVHRCHEINGKIMGSCRFLPMNSGIYAQPQGREYQVNDLGRTHDFIILSLSCRRGILAAPPG